MVTEQTIIDLGYTSPKLINGVWCGVLRLVFTTGLVVGIDEYVYLIKIYLIRFLKNIK